MRTVPRRLFRLVVGWLIGIAISCEVSAQGETPTIPKSPKREARAVWIATVLGLDWPKSHDRFEQERSLRRMIATLREANFNTVFFQVRSRSDAMYRSQYEPWSQQLTGALGEDPGWDPLAVVIEEAHAREMEVHAWFNTFLARNGGGSASGPGHHRDWLKQADGGEWWFDPGIPAVRDYIVKVALDLVRNYDLDGIQFDFARYPARSFPDDATYRRYGNRLPKDDWRRDNVSAFIRSFHDSIRMAKPRLKVGATPLGIYTNIAGAKGLEGYSDVCQDSRRWLREGWVDYLVPQVYWSLGEKSDNPDFSALARDWSMNSVGRHVYIGIGAYKPEVFNQLPELVDTVRASGAIGVSFFRYDNIARAQTIKERFQRLANIPPMRWKDPTPPNPPRDIQITNLTDGIFRLRWNPPYPASDGDGARYFNVYCSTNNPVDVEDSDNLLAILNGTTNEFIDTIQHVTAPKYYYAVSSLDAQNNESTPAVETVVSPEMAELSKQFSLDFKLGQSYPSPASEIVFVPYEVKEQSPVIVKILDGRNNEVASVVDAIQPPGRYVVATDISNLKDGTYSCLMVAGNVTLRKTIRVEN